MGRTDSNIKIRRLAETAIMLAVAVLLAEFAIFKLPFGGTVTLFSQVPVILISYRYGTKWGISSGLTLAVIELLFGLDNFSYIKGAGAFLICFFADYIIAFTVLGLGGVFRGRFKKRELSLTLGGIVVSALRFLCHFVSGATIWKEYAGETPVFLYSLVYNGSYMLPEAVVTVVGLVTVSLVFDIDSPEIHINTRRK